MRSLLFILLCSFVSSGWSAPASENDLRNCNHFSRENGQVFSLGITRSFDDDVEINLCSEEGEKFLLVKTARYLFDNDIQVALPGDLHTEPNVKNLKIKINDATFDNLHSLYNAALDFDVRDNISVNDGSTWCLESRRFTIVERKNCFSSPVFNSEKRKLNDLVKLGTELWKIATSEIILGRLY